MSLEDIVRTNEVILERFDMAVKATLSNEMICSLSNVETELYIEPTLKAMIYELRARLASEKLGHVDIKYPKDWWQALKERWFPKWLLKRYPVQYHEERYDVRAFYPKISIPKESHYIRFIKFDWREQQHSERANSTRGSSGNQRA